MSSGIANRMCSGFGLLMFVTPVFGASANEWLTWGYDQSRTGWNQAETTLSRSNVRGLELKWKTQLSTVPNEVVLSTMTSPLVAIVNTPQGPLTRVFVVGSDNTVYSIDSQSGKTVWQRQFPNTLAPKAGCHLAMPEHPKCNTGNRQRDGDHLRFRQRRQTARSESVEWRRSYTGH